MDFLRFLAGLLGDASSLGVPSNPADNNALYFLYLFTYIVNLVFMIAGAVAVIIVVVAGINYSLSVGEPSKTAKAKDAIIYSVAGLVMVAASFVIVKFIIGRFA